MDRQDQHKRAFSQAFQLINQSRLSENYTQSAKRISTSPLNPVDLYHQEYDRKNETPLDLDCVPAFDEIPGTQIRHAAPAGLSYADPSVKSHNSLQYELYSYGPGPEVEADIEYGPSPVVRNERLGSETQYDSPLPTPAVVRGRSMFGPSPYVRPDSLPSITIVNSDFRNETTSVNPNSEDSPMSDATTAINPPTPSALNFSDLSLNSEGYSIPSSPLRISVHENRTTVSIVPASSFAEYVHYLTIAKHTLTCLQMLPRHHSKRGHHHLRQRQEHPKGGQVPAIQRLAVLRSTSQWSFSGEAHTSV